MKNVVCLILVLSLCVGFNAHTQLYPEWTAETISNMQDNAHNYNEEMSEGRSLKMAGAAVFFSGVGLFGIGLSLSLPYFMLSSFGTKETRERAGNIHNTFGFLALVTGGLGIAGIATGAPLYLNGQKKYDKAKSELMRRQREAYRNKVNKKE